MMLSMYIGFILKIVGSLPSLQICKIKILREENKTLKEENKRLKKDSSSYCCLGVRMACSGKRCSTIAPNALNVQIENCLYDLLLPIMPIKCKR